VAAGVVVGGRLAAAHGAYHVDAAPFVGRWAVVDTLWPLAPLVAFAVVAVLVAPRLADRLPWTVVLWGAFGVAVAWSTLLAASEGLHAIARPLHSPADYLAGVHLIDSPARFLSTFTAEWMRYPTHVKAHPPGFVLVLWLLDRVGLGGAGWAVALELAVGASAVPAALIALRAVWSEPAARRAAPFVALAPAALWATSGDAVFAGVTAWAVTAIVLAAGQDGRRSQALAAVAGVAWTAALLSTYGAALLGAVPAAVAWWRRRLDVVLVTGSVVVVLLGLTWVVTGFWWPAGLAATHRAYLAGVAPHRAYRVFVWLDLAAFAAVIGPAAAGALGALRDRGAWLLAGGALVALAVADISGLAKGEVERIWLPWAPWLLVAAGAFPASIAVRRGWLGGQVAFAVGLQVALRSSW
jgi:hypothetical protein